MTTLLNNKDRYIENFADSVYNEYRRLNYGIKSCRPGRKLYLDEIRSDLVGYYDLGDGFTCPDNCSCSSCSSAPYATSCSGGLSYTAGASCQSSCQINTTVNNVFGTSFVWTQSDESSVWTINHNLGYVPNIFTEDEDGVDILGVVNILNVNTVRITFSAPISGKAYLS
jgi:hypothetical protein